MSTRCVLFLIMALLSGLRCFGQGCTCDERDLRLVIQSQNSLPSGFSVRGTEDLNSEEAFLAIQADISPTKTNTLRQATICRFVPFLFRIENGSILGTSVELDSESVWLIAVVPRGKRYFLAGFSDPLKDFNSLVMTLGLNIQSNEAAMSVFDLYLRLAEGEKNREAVIVDDMQLEAIALRDFRARYSLPKARSLYREWWAGISQKTRKQIQRPEVSAIQNGFSVTYFQYSLGTIFRESLMIGQDGTITVENRETVVNSVKPAM